MQHGLDLHGLMYYSKNKIQANLDVNIKKFFCDRR